MYYLDTNICSYFLNGKYEKVAEHIFAVKPRDIRIPAVVKAELLYGANRSANKEALLKKINMFLKPFEIEEFSGDMAIAYADIRANLEKEEKCIGPNDLFIAATAFQKNGILVTNNIKEFSRIEGLKVENWTE